MKWRTVIVDDEAPARRLIRQYLAKYLEIEIVGECANGAEAIRLINSAAPDLLFLDIQMPGLTGFQVLDRLEHIPAIVFSTAFQEHAVQAFEVNAIDYLLKPYDGKVVDRAVQRVLKSSHSALDAERIRSLLKSLGEHPGYTETILVSDGEKIVPVQINDIVWIQAAGDYSQLVCREQRYLCNLGIGMLESRLNPKQFIRVHRSAIISLSEVRHLRKDYATRYVITMKNGDRVKVGRTYLATLKKFIV